MRFVDAALVAAATAPWWVWGLIVIAVLFFIGSIIVGATSLMESFT
jgi:hypothetical protein